MSGEMFLALCVFAFVASVTPGPNNFMLMASGINFGWRRTLPHIAGISFGFLLLLLAIGFGIGALLRSMPALATGMKIASALYLLWLAWKIASAKPASTWSQERGQPMSFVQAALFQWINPKAWAIAFAAMAAYVTADQPTLSVLIVAVAFTLVNVPSVSVWVGFGIALRRLLSDPRKLRMVNIAMGLALVATIWPIVAG